MSHARRWSRGTWVGLLALALVASGAPVQAQSLDRLVEQLTAADLETRQEAARRLSLLRAGAQPALPALIRALSDSDDRVREHAVTALLAIGPAAAPAADALAERIRRDPSPDVRKYATYTLSRIGSPGADAALPTVLEALRDPDDSVRLGAAVAVEALDPWSGRPLGELSEALNGEGLSRLRAASALSKLGIGAAPALDAVVAALISDPDPSVRLLLLVAIDGMGAAAEPALPTLVVAAEAGNYEAGAAASDLGEAAAKRGQPLWWVGPYVLWQEALVWVGLLAVGLALDRRVAPFRPREPFSLAVSVLVRAMVGTTLTLAAGLAVLINGFLWLHPFLPGVTDLPVAPVVPAEWAVVGSVLLAFGLGSLGVEFSKPLAPAPPVADPESPAAPEALEPDAAR